MKPIKIGIAGLGNVGEEVAYQLIKGFRVQKNLFQIELVAVSASSKNKKRGTIKSLSNSTNELFLLPGDYLWSIKLQHT